MLAVCLPWDGAPVEGHVVRVELRQSVLACSLDGADLLTAWSTIGAEADRREEIASGVRRILLSPALDDAVLVARCW